MKGITEIKTSELVIQGEDFTIKIQGKGYVRFYKKDKTVQFYDKDDNLVGLYKDLNNDINWEFETETVDTGLEVE